MILVRLICFPFYLAFLAIMGSFFLVTFGLMWVLSGARCNVNLELAEWR